jgi:hypothetical protein
MHTLSQEDRDFRAAFEACRVLPADFTHRAHLRLAYCYLVAADSERAVAQFPPTHSSRSRRACWTPRSC